METTTITHQLEKITTLEQLNVRLIELKRCLVNASRFINYKHGETITIHIKDVPEELLHEYGKENDFRVVPPCQHSKQFWLSEKTPWGKIYIEGPEKEFTESFE